eukprot:3392172-Heterocapsa_arctica.AAC.1
MKQGSRSHQQLSKKVLDPSIECAPVWCAGLVGNAQVRDCSNQLRCIVGAHELVGVAPLEVTQCL